MIKTSGKTPYSSIAAGIYTEIIKNGEKSVFIKTDRGEFGLREWGTEVIDKNKAKIELAEPYLITQLKETQRKSNDPNIFEKVIAEAFNFLGFEAKHIGGKNEPDILIEDYKVILDGKSTKEGVIVSESAIGFDRLERYKEKYKTIFIGVIGPGFSEGCIRKTAKKRGVILIETEAICKILKNHAIYPYETNRIVDILFKSEKDVITPKDIPSSTIDQEKLIKIVSKILSDIKLTGKISFSIQELHIAYSWQKLNYELDEIKNALRFLSTTPFNLLQKQDEKYYLTGDIESILKKIGLLSQAFKMIGM